ncbi:MAG: hypothetical protein ACD_58C00271G0001 [uncultured bacterium]|nr:MAG: hypothetical protein ACD_58C00271G0001 [uncultured bacterium]
MDKNKMVLYVLYVLVIAALVYALVVTKGFGLMKKSTDVKTGNYQAVFLSNGQVYFGRLAGVTSSYATLEDVYYLQVQKIQPADEKSQGKLTLIKLGNELHAPVDMMKINKDQILFYENLKEEGKVMQAIQRYKEKGPDTTSTNTTDVNTQK